MTKPWINVAVGVGLVGSMGQKLTISIIAHPAMAWTVQVMVPWLVR